MGCGKVALDVQNPHSLKWLKIERKLLYKVTHARSVYKRSTLDCLIPNDHIDMLTFLLTCHVLHARLTVYIPSFHKYRYFIFRGLSFSGPALSTLPIPLI